MRTRIDKNGTVWVEPEQAGLQATQLAMEEIGMGIRENPSSGFGGWPQPWVHDSVVMDFPAHETYTIVDFVTRVMDGMCASITHFPVDIVIDDEKLWKRLDSR